MEEGAGSDEEVYAAAGAAAEAEEGQGGVTGRGSWRVPVRDQSQAPHDQTPAPHPCRWQVCRGPPSTIGPQLHFIRRFCKGSVRRACLAARAEPGRSERTPETAGHSRRWLRPSQAGPVVCRLRPRCRPAGRDGQGWFEGAHSHPGPGPSRRLVWPVRILFGVDLVEILPAFCRASQSA